MSELFCDKCNRIYRLPEKRDYTEELEHSLQFIDKMLQQAGDTDFFVCVAAAVAEKYRVKPTDFSEKK